MKTSRDFVFSNEVEFRSVADSAPLAIAITRITDGVFLFINPEYCRMMGALHVDLISKPAPDFYANPEERKSLIELMQKEGGFREVEIRLRRVSDGEIFWVSASANLGEYNGEKAIFSTLVNIDDRKKAEVTLREYSESLSRSNSELEQFAYIASHDLQEPLRMIGSYLQLLEQRYKGRLDKDADDFINYSIDGANRLQQMINDLLVFSRVQTRGKEPTDTHVELALKGALENLRPSIQESKAKISYTNLPTVNADPIQLTMLFQNLLSNAIKFHGKETPEIKISSRIDKQMVEFCILDNGIGIDPQYKDRIFVIFQKLHNRDEYPGTGIGLAVCKRIIARHGGQIWVESKPGAGTKFYFTLPQAKKENAFANQPKLEVEPA